MFIVLLIDHMVNGRFAGYRIAGYRIVGVRWLNENADP
jgi:hypothetical protein